MKILREGNGEDWSLEIECEVIKDSYGLTWDGDKEHCHSLLEINKDDIEYHPWEKFIQQISGIDYLVTCPKCGCKIYIKPNELPEWVKTYSKIKGKEVKYD